MRLTPGVDDGMKLIEQANTFARAGCQTVELDASEVKLIYAHVELLRAQIFIQESDRRDMVSPITFKDATIKIAEATLDSVERTRPSDRQERLRMILEGFTVLLKYVEKVRVT